MSAQTPIPLPSIGAHSRVLVVDDEPHNRQLFEIMMAPEGYIIDTAENGDDALAMVAVNPPDLILLDVMMPRVDGYAVAKAIKGSAGTKNIPIIMITALGDRESRMRALRAGAEEFLTKPIDRAELIVRVRNLLRLKAYSDYHDRYSRMLEVEVASRSADLVESEARFRQIAETIREVFFLVDARMTTVFYVSPAYAEMYGHSCASLYANPATWGDAIHPDDREAFYATLMPAGVLTQADVDFRILRPDGTERSLRARTFPIFDDAGQPYRFAGLVEDVTERMLLEDQLRQSAKMDAIGRLAAGVAHDFNNLLTVIGGFTDFVASDAAIGTSHTRDLGEVTKAVRRASDLTSQLLAFSRQQVMKPVPLDLSAVVSDMASMFSRLISERVKIRLDLASSLSLVLADRSQIEQVVMNLVVNAKDVMPKGGALTIATKDVKLENSVFHDETVKPGDYVMLSVTDTGAGMSRETQRRLFEPFFTTKEIGKGTGLGLSTTYGIVKQTQGHIWVYSELGIGTVFRVYLPRFIERRMRSGAANDTGGSDEFSTGS